MFIKLDSNTTNWKDYKKIEDLWKICGTILNNGIINEGFDSD